MRAGPPLAALLVALLGLAAAPAQQEAETETAPPEAATEVEPGEGEAEEKLPAILRITTDLPCLLTVGGKARDPLAAGETREVPVDLGAVTVRAVHLEVAKAVWEEEVEVEEPGTVKVRVRMERTLRDERQRQRREDVYRNPKKNLMWSLRDNGRDIDWERAARYCAEYRLGGFEDWRLPTLAELETLQAIWSRAQYKTVGGVMLSACCAWSSDRRGPNRAWNFNFRFRKEFAINPVFTYDLRALCVRDWSEEAEKESSAAQDGEPGPR